MRGVGAADPRVDRLVELAQGIDVLRAADGEQLLVDGPQDHGRGDGLAGRVAGSDRHGHLVARSVARLVGRQCDVDPAVLGPERPPCSRRRRRIRIPVNRTPVMLSSGRPRIRTWRRTAARPGRRTSRSPRWATWNRYAGRRPRAVRGSRQREVDPIADAVPVGRLDPRSASSRASGLGRRRGADRGAGVRSSSGRRGRPGRGRAATRGSRGRPRRRGSSGEPAAGVRLDSDRPGGALARAVLVDRDDLLLDEVVVGAGPGLDRDQLHERRGHRGPGDGIAARIDAPRRRAGGELPLEPVAVERR